MNDASAEECRTNSRAGHERIQSAASQIEHKTGPIPNGKLAGSHLGIVLPTFRDHLCRMTLSPVCFLFTPGMHLCMQIPSTCYIWLASKRWNGLGGCIFHIIGVS